MVLDVARQAFYSSGGYMITKRKKAPNGEPERFYREVVLAWTSDECLLWPYAKVSTGYGQIAIEPGRKGKRVLVHRRACEDINGPPPGPNYDAAHSCGKGHLGCCNPKHVRWATRTGNVADAIAHGTAGRGTGGYKLDRLKAAEIRNRLTEGVSQRKIAKEFGVSQAMVSKINTGYHW